jgi:hypothetical protein
MTHFEKLKILAAWDTEPVLTETEVEDILTAAATADAEGNSPATDNWIPTYDLNKAAADAWLIKAGRASATVEAGDGAEVATSKVFDNCLAMARLYTARRNMSVSLV